MDNQEPLKPMEHDFTQVASDFREALCRVAYAAGGDEFEAEVHCAAGDEVWAAPAALRMIEEHQSGLGATVLDEMRSIQQSRHLQEREQTVRNAERRGFRAGLLSVFSFSISPYRPELRR